MKLFFKNISFLIFNLLLLISFTGCKYEEVEELDCNEIIYMPHPFYYERDSSIPIWFSLTFTLENAKFECNIKEGSFSENELVKQITVDSNVTIGYKPIYMDNGNEVKVKKDAYLDVIIYKNNEIIGYIVFNITCPETNSMYYSKVYIMRISKASLFMDYNGDYKPVSKNYVNNRIKAFH